MMNTNLKVNLLATAALLAVLTIAPTAQASTIALFDTGVDGGGAPLLTGAVETHYSLVVPGGPLQALTSLNPGGFPIPPWLGDDSLSAWIGPSTTNAVGPGGVYDYRTTFDLTGLNPTTATIKGQWSSDNTGLQILINGIDSLNASNPYGTDGSYSFQHWQPFLINSGFHSGVNTLDFIVFNGNAGSDTAGPTGLRVEMTGIASPVPEASTWVMMLLGFSGLGFMARRKLKPALMAA
jgi:hypothetical protein